MIGKVLGILGAAALGATALLPWQLKKGMPDPTGEGFRPDISIPGLDTLPVQVIVGLAGLSLILFFIKPRFAALTGLLAIVASIWYYFAEFAGQPKFVSLGMGFYIAVVGAILVIAGAMLYKPKRG